MDILRIDKEMEEVIDELISLGLAEDRSKAANLLMRVGVEEARRMIRRRKRVLELLDKFRHEGVPYRLPRLEELMRERGT